MRARQTADGHRKVGGKVKGRRLLITMTEQEHRLIERAAKAEGARLGLRLPVATYIRRAAVLAARAALEPSK